MERIIIFIGKGGVGKTTLSVSISSFFATLKRKVYLVSLDPAHNLFHFMGIDSHDPVVEINNYLVMEEFDSDHYIKRYLKHTSEIMKDTYKHLSILNLEGMFDILKHSPGMSEYAMIHALYELIQKCKTSVNYLVIDTPPTGLSMRLFTIPTTTLIWLEKLKDMRMKILNRRRQVRHIKGSDTLWSRLAVEKEKDPVFSELITQEEILRDLLDLFKNQEICKIVLILNYDELSIKEGIEVLRELKDLNIAVSLIVFNKVSAEDKKDISIVNKIPSEIPQVEIPLMKPLHSKDQKERIGELLAGWLQ